MQSDSPTPQNVPIAEVISIGDEMTSGARLDTNSQWLSVMLGELGIRVLYHSTVGDSLEACCRTFEIAAGRASIIVSTGGLGPTADDLTREAIAAAAGTTLEFREEAMRHIESLFARRNREMPERNRVQAMFPVGSTIIPNPQGTAPGIDMVIARDVVAGKGLAGKPHSARVFSLPGVPAEMRQMWDATVAQSIRAHVGPGPVIRKAVVKCFGLGESEMEHRLGGMIARLRSPLVGITVSQATIALRIDATANSVDEAEQQIDSVRKDIFERVGDYVFGEGDDFELSDAVIAKLMDRNESLCTVELGHAGLLGSWLSGFEGSKDGIYHGGLQAASLDAAGQLLGLNVASEEGNDAETRATRTREIARQMLANSKASWCVIVDRYPSLIPADGRPLPAADVRFTICGAEGKKLLECDEQLGGHPDILQSRIAKAALFHLFCHLRSLN